MTNLEALEKLYISLGGVESDLEGVNTTAEVIDLIKDVAGGGAGGGGAFVVHCEGTYESDGENESISYTFDKTPSQVLEAYNAGQIVVFRRIEEYETTTDFYLVAPEANNYMIGMSMKFYRQNMTFESIGCYLYCEENEFINMTVGVA